MKAISIDKLYYQLDKHILLAQSYTEIKELFFIIKSCRLKPYSYFFEEKNPKLILHKWWFDEFGNSLQITTGKKIKITYNHLSLDKSQIVCTDLYYGLSLDKVAKLSKLAYLYIGKDEDLYENCAIITFLGIDNYLRSYMYLYGEWQQVSPLLLGMKHLIALSQHRDIKFFKELRIKEKPPLPCVAEMQWLTFIPPNKALTSLLDKKYEGLFSFLKPKE